MKPIINDYVFYKITCDELPEYIYIGSTVHFIKRKSNHKTNCTNTNRKEHNLKLYKTIRENGGWDKWQMIVIDEAKHMTLTEARIKEEALRKEYNGNLNMNKAYSTVEELKEDAKKYYENNKKSISEKKKEYEELNKEIIAEKKSEKITCECGAVFVKYGKNRHINSLKHQQFCQPIDLSI
tara:strand:- start:149 stop:691 length:543 start_codon:yes stop_codon:yes gene_type:complete